MNKKNYITPASKVYNVSTAGKFMDNISFGGKEEPEPGEEIWGSTKGERSEKGSAGIWDLYNN